MAYFIHDPEGNLLFFDNEKEFEKGMEDYDLFEIHCPDGWSEEVTNVIGGFVPNDIIRNEDEESDDWEDEQDFYEKYATHHVVEFDRQDRPDDIDEDGYSHSYGGEWPHDRDWDYIVNYRFEKKEGNPNDR